MAHAAPPPPGRQKRNAVIGAVVLVVGVVLAVVAFIGLNNPKGPNSAGSGSRSTSRSASGSTSSQPSSSPSTRPSTSPTPSSQRPTTTARTTPPRTSTTAGPSLPLTILNNTGRPGLAALAESRFEGRGWKVTSLANYSNSDIISTCAYWDASVPGSEAAAQQLQREFPNIQRVKQRFDELPSGPVVVVLDDDYS